MGNNHSVRMQVMCALFTAVCAVFSQLTIPIQPVPITLGSFAALMAGGFLGKRYGFLSLVIYLLLGMAGVPVFSMMRAGVSVIAGPSGGFIVGFAVMAFIVGLVGEKLGFTFKNMLLGTVLGTADFCLLETNSMMFRKALRECLLYYLLQDLWLSHSLDFQVLFKRRTTRCQV